jgi:hypothetical protein
MRTWGEFVNEAPQLAAHGERLINQFGVGLGFLGTVRQDGGLWHNWAQPNTWPEHSKWQWNHHGLRSTPCQNVGTAR